MQEGKTMTAQEEGRTEGMFPREGGNPNSSRDVLLKIPIISEACGVWLNALYMSPNLPLPQTSLTLEREVRLNLYTSNSCNAYGIESVKEPRSV